MGEQKHVTLRMDGVSKVFAKVESDEVTHALNTVDLTMTSGEFISLVGPSGCGKSTILRLIAGLILPTTGTVTVDGKPVTAPSPQRGMVFQNTALFPWLTVMGNVEYGPKVQGVKKQERRARAQRYIDLVGSSDTVRVLREGKGMTFEEATS